MLKTRAGNVIGAAPQARAEPINQQRLDRVLSFAEVIKILGVSKPTFHRTIKPKLRVVQLSARRCGVRERDLAAWIEAKTRAA